MSDAAQVIINMPSIVDVPGSLIGLFTTAATHLGGAGVYIPSDIYLVETSGYSSLDVGSAIFVYDATVDSTYVAAHPRSSFLSSNGRGFRLSTEQDITPGMLGATGLGAADDYAAFQAAADLLPGAGGKITVLAGTYNLSTEPTWGAKNVRWDISPAATFTGAGTGAGKFPNTTLRGVLSIEAFGAVGNGTTDDTAKLQAALNTGKVVELQNGSDYLISSGLDHVNGAGFFCAGHATITAKTGTGGFNVKDTSSPRTGLDRNMLRCNGTDDLTLKGVHFRTDGATEVVLHGIRLNGGMATEGYDIDVSFSGFKVGSMVVLCSAGAGRRRKINIPWAINCGITLGGASGAYWTYPTSPTSVYPQTTVVEIDNDILAATPSAPGTIRIGRIQNILFSGSALTDFGQQTDGVNIVCQGVNSTYGWDCDIGLIDGVGEPLDIQGWRNSFRVGTIKNAYNDAVKLIHGSQYNTITVGAMEATGRSAVAIFGSSSSVCDRDTKGNSVKIGTLKLPGTYGLGTSGATQAVIFGGGTFHATKNVVTIDEVIGDGTNLDYVVADGSGAGNTDNRVIVRQASGFAIQSVSAPPANVRVTYDAPSFTKLTMSAPQTGIATATATKLAYDTIITDVEGIAVTGSNKVTVKWPGLYFVRASAELSSQAVGSNDQWTMEVRQGSSAVTVAKSKIQFSGKDESCLAEALVYIGEDQLNAVTADLSVYFTQDTGSARTVNNAATMTFLSVARMA